jgi:hypothetical protein
MKVGSDCPSTPLDPKTGVEYLSYISIGFYNENF